MTLIKFKRKDHFEIKGFFISYIKCPVKRYFIVDQQIARHFVHYSECTNPLPFYLTQMINPFLILRTLANHDKGLGFYFGIIILALFL